MAIIQGMTQSFLAQLLEGVHDFRSAGGDTYKIALYGANASLGPQTTAYTTTGEIVASGYTAGGATLTCITPNSAGTPQGPLAYSSFLTATWSGSGIAASGALIYNTTPTHTYSDPSVMVLNFGMSRSAVSGVFTVTFPTNNTLSAILRLGVSANVSPPMSSS